MKRTIWNVVLGFLWLFVTSSSVAQAEEKVIPPQDDYFLAISFASKDPNVKKYKFKESIERLDVHAVYQELTQFEEITQVSLYKDGIAITRKTGTPWADLEKKVMLVLKDQFKVTGYVLFDGNKLTEEQIKRYLSGT